MGWISTPRIPLTDMQGNPILDGWMGVESAIILGPEFERRIRDGAKLRTESTPLGLGQGKVMSREFFMPGNGTIDGSDPFEVKLEAVILHQLKKPCKSSTGNMPEVYRGASARFCRIGVDGRVVAPVTFRLKHGAFFVTAHPCRPPHGHVGKVGGNGTPTLGHKHGENLPCHPLHQSYKYEVRRIQDVLSTGPPEHLRRDGTVWVMDASRGSDQDVFIRAWCAEVGRHALVSSIGRACLSCSVREAFALEIGIIIRVKLVPP